MHVHVDGVRLPAEAILLDKDGTILPFQPAWTTWMEALLSELAAHVDPARLAAATGWDTSRHREQAGGSVATATMAAFAVGLRTALRAEGLDQRDATRLAGSAMAVADAAMARVPVTAHTGFGRFLEECRAARIAVGVVTGDDTARAEAQLRALGLRHLVGPVIGGDRDLPGKPSPEPIVAGCAAVGIEPARTTYVGDSLVDLMAATGAGAAHVAFVAEGDPAPWTRDAHAVVRGFGELRVAGSIPGSGAPGTARIAG